MATVLLHTAFSPVTGGVTMASFSGGTVRAVLDQAEERFPGLKRLLYEHGDPGKHTVYLFVNKRNISLDGGLDMELQEGDELQIIPIMTGG